MKRVLLVSFLLATTVSLVGCATAAAWWSSFKTNPASQVQSILSDVEIVKSVATATFESIKLALSADKQATAEAEFQRAMLTVNAAESAVQAVVVTAAEAQQPNPDFGTVFTDVSTAISALEQVVHDWKTQIPTATGSRRVVAPAADSDLLTQQVVRLKARLGHAG